MVGDAKGAVRVRSAWGMRRKVAPTPRGWLCCRAMLRSAFPRCAVAAALLLAQVAGAQQVSLSQTPDRRTFADASKQAAFRSASKFPDWINYADCASNVLLHFQLAVSNIPTNGTLQVWAGTDDCSKLEARTGETTRTCWPVSAVLPSQQNVSVDVWSQHVVGYVSKTASEKPKTFADLPTASSPSLCTLSAQGATAVKLWFMFTDGSNNVMGTPMQWATSVDVVGPSAPTALTASAGDGAVNLSWTVSDAVSDVSEYVVYCLPQSTTVDSGGAASDAAVASDAAPSADAGTSVDASSDAGEDAGTIVDASSDAGTLIDDAGSASAEDAGSASTTDGGAATTCIAPWSPEPSTPLTSEFLASIAKYECGRIGGSSRSSRVSGFAYGVPVAVAIAAVDQVNNAGGIRAGNCVAPVRTISFWDRYEEAGGDAGGCSYAPPVLSGSALSFSALLGLAAALRLRRKGR